MAETEPKLTKKMVIQRVRDIEAMAGDDESAHSAEDSLWRDVLQAIAGGEPDARAFAHEALKTRDINFARWCA